LALLEAVIARQARLVAHWMSLGFIHGVMNTDNTSISGETIDYGPCAFLDGYDPAKRFSYIDEGGRYAYGNQPNIALWNATRLAETLLPLMGADRAEAVARAQAALDRFADFFQDAWTGRFAAKIGIPSDLAAAGDRKLVLTLLDHLRDGEADFTLAFRHLAAAVNPAGEAAFLAQFREPGSIAEWLSAWRRHLEDRGILPEAARETMRQANPVFIPRNHRIEEVIQAGREGNFAPFHRLHAVLQRPFDDQPEHAEFEAAPQEHERVQATFCGT
jgi:uncharacterized protein YdiU (UPF0061 family)